jgi:glucose/arabinose dehydrogenase
MDQLYTNNCANCHGDRGQGGGAGTRTLLTDDLFDQKHDRPFFDTIKKGAEDKGMAPFGETLSNEQVWGLVNYIRELQARDRRQRTGSVSRKLDKEGVCTTSLHRFKIERVVDKGLKTPWSVEFMPDGDSHILIVTNRPGQVMLFKGGKNVGTLQGTPKVRNQGQGGLMDVTLHPNFAMGSGQDWVYLAYTDPFEGTDTKGMTKVVRGHIRPEIVPASKPGSWKWEDEQVIFQPKSEHYSSSGVHFGCKIVFDPKDANIIFFGIGERGSVDLAQNLSRPNGKIHRLHADGKTPADNPFLATKDAMPSVWSFGHRNPQGLVFDLAGVLWDTEHGPRGGDELNRVERSRNYGWPVVSFGINYSGAVLKTPWPDLAPKGVQDLNIMLPVDRWMPSIGACGLGVVTGGPKGDVFAKWKGDLIAGGLSGSNVDRIRIVDGKVVDREEIVHGLGRVRDCESAPDGTIYVVLNDPDQVIRLVPVN